VDYGEDDDWFVSSRKEAAGEGKNGRNWSAIGFLGLRGGCDSGWLVISCPWSVVGTESRGVHFVTFGTMDGEDVGAKGAELGAGTAGWDEAAASIEAPFRSNVWPRRLAERTYAVMESRTFLGRCLSSAAGK